MPSIRRVSAHTQSDKDGQYNTSVLQATIYTSVAPRA